MSSPNINNVIVFGGMLTYTCVVLLGIDSALVTDEVKMVILCKVSMRTFGEHSLLI